MGYSLVNRYQVSFGDGFLIEKNLNTSSYFLNKIITLSFDADVITKAFLDVCKLKKIKETNNVNKLKKNINKSGINTILLSRQKGKNEARYDDNAEKAELTENPRLVEKRLEIEAE